MESLDAVPGAGLLLDGRHTVIACNNRCPVVFKTEVETLQGQCLESLRDGGWFGERTYRQWSQAVSTVIGGDRREVDVRIELAPGDGSARSRYELRVTPAESGRVACCSLRSVGTGRRYDETITALHAATRELMIAEDTREVLERVAVAASEVLGFPGTAVRIHDEGAGMLRHVSFGSRVENIDTRPPYHVEESPHGRALRRGETVIDDIDDDDPYDREVFTQTMYVPIGETGLLSVGTVGNTFDETDVQFAEILAENAAAAIRAVESAASLRREREQLELIEDILMRVLRHNIRNDLTVIRGVTDELETVCDPDSGLVERLSDATDDIQRLSEKAGAIKRLIDADHRTMAVRLDAVVRETVASVSRAYPNATVETDLEPCRVRAHPNVQRAVENLLENACEHVDAADGEIRFDRQDGTRVEVTLPRAGEPAS